MRKWASILLLALLLFPSLSAYTPIQAQTQIDPNKPPPTEFKPKIDFSEWDNESWMQVEYYSLDAKFTTISLEDNKMIWKSDKQEVSYYKLPDSEQYEEGYEYEVILKEPPSSSILTFKLDTKNFVFHYQPPLNEEKWPKDYTVNETHALDEKGKLVAYRSINIVSSYAVYHSSKRDNEYKTGKAFHIHRPYIEDSNGLWTWGELNIVDGIMTIKLPIAFLANAVYPVYCDPTFGKTDLGGSSSNWGGDATYVTRHELTEAGTVISLHVYNNDTTPNGNVNSGIYNETGVPDPLNVTVGPAGQQAAIFGWNNLTVSQALVADFYWIGGYFTQTNLGGLLYDVGAVGQTRWENGEFPDPYGAGNALAWIISMYANYTIVTNNAPTTESASIGNMDDSDNLYSQLRNYNFNFTVSDADGAGEIHTLNYSLEIGANWINGTIQAWNGNAHSFYSGGTRCTVGAITNTTNGNYNRFIVPLRMDWDVWSQANNDLHLWCNDTSGDPSGWTEEATNYFDTVNDLLTNSIECTDPNDPDRVDVSATIGVDFNVRYENDPASGVATTFYPPDAEFTSISVYDEWNNVLFTDNSIVNGAGSGSGTANATVQETDYNLYINMADADYSDGEETLTEAVRTDRFVFRYGPGLDVVDNRTSADGATNGEWYATLDYDYDNVMLDHATVNLNTGTMSWDAGDLRHEYLFFTGTTQNATRNIQSVTGATYNITVVAPAVSNDIAWVVFDKILTYWEQLNDTRVDINAWIEGRYRAVLEWDDHPLAGADTLTSGWGALAWDGANAWFEISHSEAAVGAVNIAGWGGNETTYVITTAIENLTEADYIYDRIRVLTLACNNSFPLVNQTVLIWSTADLQYDAHALGAGDYHILNDTAGNQYNMTWNVGNARFETTHMESIVVVRTISVFHNGSEATYGITVGFMNGNSLAISWGGAPPAGNTFDAQVVNSTGNPIPNAQVTVTNGSGIVFSVPTNATGQIATQTLDNGTYTISVSAVGYITLTFSFNMTTDINWIISLLAIEEGTVIYNSFDMPLLVLFCVSFVSFILQLYSGSPIVGVVASFGFFGTSLYWLRNVSTLRTFSLMWAGLGVISLFVIFYHTYTRIIDKRRNDRML